MSLRKTELQNQVVIMRTLVAMLRRQGGQAEVHIRALECQITETLEAWEAEKGEPLLP